MKPDNGELTYSQQDIEPIQEILAEIMSLADPDLHKGSEYKPVFLLGVIAERARVAQSLLFEARERRDDGVREFVNDDEWLIEAARIEEEEGGYIGAGMGDAELATVTSYLLNKNAELHGRLAENDSGAS